MKNGVAYKLRGEQYYPMFKESEQYQIGKYGLLHLEYIKAHRKPLYFTLLTIGKLNEYLHQIDQQTHELLNSIVARLAAERGVNESLKAENALLWVQEMNNCKSDEEEIVLNELIYK